MAQQDVARTRETPSFGVIVSSNNELAVQFYSRTRLGEIKKLYEMPANSRARTANHRRASRYAYKISRLEQCYMSIS